MHQKILGGGNTEAETKGSLGVPLEGQSPRQEKLACAKAPQEKQFWQVPRAESGRVKRGETRWERDQDLDRSKNR